MSDEQLEPKDYSNAILVQDACNLSGVVHSFSSVMEKIWSTARATGCGTEWVNNHPIAVMYANKIASLTGQYADASPAFGRAYDICKSKAENG